MFIPLYYFFVFLFSCFAFVKSCPEETLKGPDGNCYGFFPYSFNHTKSEYVCKNFYGGHLASIRNKEMNEFLQNTALEVSLGATNFWVGGKREDLSADWSWIDGREIGYTNWELGQERGGSGYHGLAVNLRTGKWHSLPEITSLPYVCLVHYKKRMPTFFI